MPLERELAYYDSIKERLVAENPGKFALVKGSELIDVFGTYEDALKAGYGRFGLEPFLVKKIEAVQVVQSVTRLFDTAECHI